MNNAICTEQNLFELLPNSLLQTLVTNLSLAAPPSMYTLLSSQPGFSRALRAKSERFFKNEAIKAIGIFEYHAILLGVPEIQAATLADLFLQQIEACHGRVADQILRLVCAFYDELAKTCRLSFRTRPQNIVSHCMEYIENSAHSPFSLAAMARALERHPSYLCQKFKKETGITLHQYATQCKMKEAATLLTLTDRSLLDISELLCYSSQSHFQRIFKSYYGVTPQQWRKSSKI